MNNVHLEPLEIIPCAIPSNKRFINLTGLHFGQLTVNALVGRRTVNGINYYYWLCKCNCGRSTLVISSNLRSRATSSCGCGLKRLPQVPELTVWRGMKDRCENPKHTSFHCYGGRGIKICGTWSNSFESFYRDMGPRPSPRHTIDRIDSTRDYTPDNCRWATIIEQNRNRRGVLKITFRGQTMCASAWDDFLGFKRRTVQLRLYHGWTVERALTEPIRITARWPKGVADRFTFRAR